MPRVEEGRLVVDLNEDQTRFALEMLDVDGNVVAVPVWSTTMGFTSDQPYLHVTSASVIVGRTILVDTKTGEKIVTGDDGYAPWDPSTARPRHGHTMELT